MAELLLANNATTTLLTPTLAGDIIFVVQPGDAAKFPAPAAGQIFKVTLENKNTGAFEIVHCSIRAGNLFTVTRAQEGTVAQAFPAGSIVACRVTKEMLERVYQPVRQPPVAIASAADLNVLGTTGYQQVAGVTNINRILKTGRDGGSLLTLKFNGNLTVNHAVASGGAYAGIVLTLGLNLARVNGQTLSLVYDEIDNLFFQRT